MGLLNNILGGIEKATSSIGAAVGNVYQNTLAKVPFVPAIKSAVEKNPEIAFFGVGSGSIISKVPTPLVSKIGSSVGSSILKTAAANPIKTSIAAAVITPAVLSSPKLQTGIINAPSSFVNVGKNIGQLVENPSLENAKTLFSENPVIVGGTAAVLGSTTLKGGASIVSTYLNTKAIKENTAASQNFGISPVSVIPESSQTYSSDKPLTRQTEEIKLGEQTKTKRRRKTQNKKETPNINQRVNILIQNKNNSVGIKQTKRYLNNEVLAY